MDCYGYTKSYVNVVAPVKVRILCIDVSDGASDKEHDLACGREPTAASQRKCFLELIQRQQERCAAIITPFPKLMRK